MDDHPNDAIRRALRERRERTDAWTEHATTWDRKRTRRATVLEVFCQKRSCHLLTVWKTPRDGLAYRQPAYRLAPEMNAQTSDAGARRAKTTDGDRKWRARAGLLADVGDGTPLTDAEAGQVRAGLALTCDHVAPRFVSAADLEAWAGIPGTPARVHL